MENLVSKCESLVYYKTNGPNKSAPYSLECEKGEIVFKNGDTIIHPEFLSISPPNILVIEGYDGNKLVGEILLDNISDLSRAHVYIKELTKIPIYISIIFLLTFIALSIMYLVVLIKTWPNTAIIGLLFSIVAVVVCVHFLPFYRMYYMVEKSAKKLLPSLQSGP